MQITKARVFFISAVSFIGGVFLQTFFVVDEKILSLFLAVVGTIIFTVYFRNTAARLFVISILLFAVGVWRGELALREVSNTLFEGEKISESAIVVREPVRKEKYKRAYVHLEEHNVRVLIYADPYSDISHGDRMNISCILAKVENFSDSFDWKMFLAKDHVYYQCRSLSFEKRNEEKKTFYEKIILLRRLMEANINHVIPEPHAGLANGLLFGGDNRLPENVEEDFTRTGMTHIVAVSGFNVTIIAGYLMIIGIALGLWRKHAFWFALSGIVLFVAMIGFPPSAVRAGIMGSLVLFAMHYGRLGNALNALLCAAVVMLFLNPLLLRYDIGFQLSFLATLGIILCAPLFESRALSKHRALGFSEILLLTFSAQIFVLPIILFQFEQFSTVSLLSNLLVLPIVPVTMLFVFVSSVSGFFLPPLSIACGWIAYLLLQYELWVIHSFAEFSWASFPISNFGPLAGALYYGGVFVVVRYLRAKHFAKRKKEIVENM